MKILSKEIVSRSKSFIWANCSELTQALFTHYLEKTNVPGVINALSTYQNEDGGFGHNLEGDFELPDSSPLATSVAFQILSALEVSHHETVVQNGIRYLINEYEPGRNGWFSVPPQVNDFPHAGWWHYIESERGTVIDQAWGNPTAELVGVLLKYSQLLPENFLVPIYLHTLQYLREFQGEMDMHELYCFLRFAKNMPQTDFELVKARLIHFVMNTVTTEPEGWEAYSAQPLDFVTDLDSFLYDPLMKHVQSNLNYWIDHIKPDGMWYPNWSWENYPQAWEKARIQIAGRLSVNRLQILKKFNRLER